MLKRRDVVVMRFSQYIAAISIAADAELMQTRSSRIRRVPKGRRLKSSPMTRRPQPEGSVPMHKAWKDWLTLNSIELVFTGLVVAVVACVDVLMRYSL